MTKPNNPPAFPRTGFEADTHQSMSTDTQPQEGMTLRDYFAAKAMQGLCALPQTRHANDAETTEISWGKSIAIDAYKFADAMLAERMKNEQ